MPLDVPKVREVVPAGLTHVVRAAGLIPIDDATLLFSSLTIEVAFDMSKSKTFPEAIPVIETPIRASFSVVLRQTSRK